MPAGLAGQELKAPLEIHAERENRLDNAIWHRRDDITDAKIVTSNVAVGIDLAVASRQLCERRIETVIGVDIYPVEISVRKSAEHLN